MVVEVGLAPEIVTSGRADKIERCQRKNSLDSGLVNEWDGEIGERAKNVETFKLPLPDRGGKRYQAEEGRSRRDHSGLRMEISVHRVDIYPR